MFTWLKKEISKKLFIAIATPLLTTALIAGNKALGSPISDTEIIAAVGSIVATAVTYLFGQAQIDKAKVEARKEILAADVANPNTATTAVDVMALI